MNPIPLIRAAVVTTCTRFLDRLGAPTERVLEQVSLSSALLSTPDRLLPLVQSATFLENAARKEGIDHLGALIGQQTQVSDLGAFGEYLASAFTLYDLLTKLERRINLLNSGERVQLIWQPQGVWLQSDLYGIDAKTNPQGHFYSIMVYLNALRLALGPTWTPAVLHLATAPCPALLSLKELTGVQIYFDQPYNAIHIANGCGELPLRTVRNGQPPPTHDFYRTLYQSAPASTFVGSLHQLIGALMLQGYPTIEMAAAAVGTSVRSLQRRLAQLGLSYSQLVEQVRLDLAMVWLQDPGLKLTDLAVELGYTHPSNFTRAFKRWTGLSPQQYRQHRL